MSNMLNFMSDYGDLSYASMPFGPVDNLIFSQLSYCAYDALPPRMPTRFSSMYGLVKGGVQKSDAELLDLACTRTRFSHSYVYRYSSQFDENISLQFAAATFLLSDGTAYISFRGTDSTLVGWKEDFHLAFDTPVPAQTLAVQYLNSVAGELSCPLRVGGHSKGGNLAVYASSYCDESVQKRIIAVYNNDGPGHDLKTVHSDGYLRVAGRIATYIPRSSIIGMLLEHSENYYVVDSDAHGLFQHNPYSWQTSGASFLLLPRTSAVSDTLNESIREWLSGMDTEKRRFLTNTVFDVLGAGEATTLRELRSDTHSLAPVLTAAMTLPAEDRKQLLALAAQFLKTAASQYSALAHDSVNPLIAFWEDMKNEAAPLADKFSSVRQFLNQMLDKRDDTTKYGGQKK